LAPVLSEGLKPLKRLAGAGTSTWPSRAVRG